ncbi:hypothetical protein Tco_0973842 [Tanacetum coccineum]|uniref:Uncharacterized protein n=1 Tax=Tanacetum coccineum TaxID=301880 RepID=A0ABQ5E9W2_9ASTR
MEKEPDIKNMTLNEYLEYEAEKERRSWRNDIAIEDVEWIRKFLTPNIPDVIDDVTQPLIPKPIHTIPPDEDYVAPATKSILDELLEEFGDEILTLCS